MTSRLDDGSPLHTATGGAGRAAVRPVALGLVENWPQFALLIAINAFVGGMAGLERTVVPLLAEGEFGVTSTAAAVSFVATFGVGKALANLFAGSLSHRFTRRRVLIAGWLLAVPVPFVLIWAPSWGWVVAANSLLGLNQGLAWSMTVNMKLDLVGPRNRGLALGLNEAAGYLSVAAAAFATGIIAHQYGLRPEPFYLGIGLAAAGLALSVLFAKDTGRFLALEASDHRGDAPSGTLTAAFAATTWRDRRLFGLSQAGLVNNLNDALAWGIFPVFFVARGLPLDEVALLAAGYPLVWGFLQTGTGWAGDLLGRRPLVAVGMLLQGTAIFLVAAGGAFAPWAAGVILLGVGTAMVYPTLLAAIADAVHPEDRANSVAVYRFWRDSGAVAGALLAGLVADALGLSEAIYAVGGITVASGLLAWVTLREPPAPAYNTSGDVTCM